MNENEELIKQARTMWEFHAPPLGDGMGVSRDSLMGLMYRVIEALAAKPRMVATVEELDALPAEAVVYSETIAYQKCGDQVWDGYGRQWDAQQIDLPAVVIYIPEAPID